MSSSRTASSLAALVLVSASAVSAPAYAADGRLEIHQECVAAGCFPGDAAGFPVQLTGGNYILTSDLNSTLAGGATALTITGGTTLDLNGFNIVGNPPDGIGVIEINTDVVEVRNGGVFAIAGDGITSTSRSSLRLLELRVGAVARPAINLSGGSDIEIRDAVVRDSGGHGVFADGEGVAVTGCTVSNSTGSGIVAGSRALVADNIVRNSGGNGVNVGQFSLVRGNVIVQSGDFGIDLAGDSLVLGNTVANAASGAIEVCATCTVVDNEVP